MAATERVTEIWRPDISPDYAREIYSLTHHPIFEAQTRMIEARISPHNGLSVEFTPKPKYRTSDGFYHGVERFLGNSNCLGFIFVHPGYENEAYKVAIAAQKEMARRYNVHDRATVSVLHVEDVPLWRQFYDSIVEHDLLQSVGTKVLTYSGLRRINPRQQDWLHQSLDGIFRKHRSYLAESGVASIVPAPEYDLDGMFLNADGQIVSLPLYRVKTVEFVDNVLIEHVQRLQRFCPGYVLRRPWENKIEVYERAEHAKRRFASMQDPLLEILVGSPGQVALFAKNGRIDRRQENQVKDVPITVEDIEHFGWHLDSNIAVKEAPFASRGLSLPYSGRDFGVDVLFVRRTPDGLDHEHVTVNDLMCIRKAHKQDTFDVKQNVGALLLVPDDMDEKQFNKVVADAEVALRRSAFGYHVEVGCVTPKLFEYWKTHGPFVEPEIPTIQTEAPLNGNGNGKKHNGTSLSGNTIAYVETRHVENGQRPTAAHETGNKYSWHIRQQGAMIGGVQMALRVETPEGFVYDIAVDIGAIMSDRYRSKRKQRLTSKPKRVAGINPYLRDQGGPMVQGWYYYPFLGMGARIDQGLLERRSTDPVTSYTRAELLARDGEDGFTLSDVLPIGSIDAFKDIARVDMDKWWGKKRYLLSNIVTTHGHQDHIGGMHALRHAELIMRRQTHGGLTAITARGMTWRERVLNITRVDLPEGEHGHVIEPRDVRIIDRNDDILYLGHGVSMQGLLVGHSMPGTMAVRFFGKFRPTFYGADMKFDTQGATEKMIHTVAGKDEIYYLEATKTPDERIASLTTSEHDVVESLIRVIRENEGRPTIIQLPWNHLDRMMAAWEAAIETKRNIAFSFDHLEFLMALKHSHDVAPQGAEGFYWQLPVIGEDVGVWQPLMSKLLTYQRGHVNRATERRLGIVDTERLRDEGGDWVIVTGQSRSLEDDLEGAYLPNGVAVVHAASFPYSSFQREDMEDNRNWVIWKNGGESSAASRYYSDIELFPTYAKVKRHPLGPFASSGHGSAKDIADIAIGLLNGSYRGKEIHIIHGNHPQISATYLVNEIIRKLGLKRPGDLKVVAQHHTYRPKNPILFPGDKTQLN